MSNSDLNKNCDTIILGRGGGEGGEEEYCVHVCVHVLCVCEVRAVTVLN